MDYKKKYKEALARAKKLKETFDSAGIAALSEYIFPEIKESEEEKIRKALIKAVTSIKKGESPWFVSDKETCDKVLDWLEKRGEQTPAWSEEDEVRLTNIIIMLKEGASHHFVKEDITNSVDWLKSLKDRYTWKPSEEQLNALDEVYKTHGANSSCRRIIFNLLDQLKKL